MKKTICLLIALVLCTALAIPAMAVIGGTFENGVYNYGIYQNGENIPAGLHDGAAVYNNCSVKIEGAVKLVSRCSIAICGGSTLTIKNGGSLSGTDIFYGQYEEGSKIVLENGAWIKLQFFMLRMPSILSNFYKQAISLIHATATSLWQETYLLAITRTSKPFVPIAEK